jgi:hypothetical protein
MIPVHLQHRYAIDLSETRYKTTREFLASGHVVELNDAHNKGTFFSIDGKLYEFPLAFIAPQQQQQWRTEVAVAK